VFVVWACDTASEHSEKICQTNTDIYVCALKPVKNSALHSTTLSGDICIRSDKFTVNLYKELLFDVIHHNSKCFCDPFVNIELNITFVYHSDLAMQLLWHWAACGDLAKGYIFSSRCSYEFI
jgi:hypothetical protein